ncbi:MAG: metal-dependent transcriptional regulator [Amoebophilaceae bacterium]|jgi:DtxR family Mn-dependent transcriptional regulator|nr:metal-dependent transcriptional regulator [Amoebophilaceae bacterium]
MHVSYTEEDYLKVIYQYVASGTKAMPTNAIADALNTSAAAVTDMLQKLHEKELVVYQKYRGVHISEKGKVHALQVIRKHLLWEVFLVEKLKFGWEEVHAVAEQLEHVQSSLLIQRLDDFLGNPPYSPHGESIPDAHGACAHKVKSVLTDVETGSGGIVLAVQDSTPQFLQYLSKRGIYLGAKISVIEKIAFDQSMDISVDHLPKVNVSQKVSDNILITY